MATETVYRRLQQHLDQMPVGFPATDSGVELRLLEHLFTPEEAGMALHLGAFPEPIEKIHGRAKKEGVELADLRDSLQCLAAKGSILQTTIDGKPHYSKAPLAIGIFELQVNRLTKELHSDFLQYMDEAFATAFHTTKTSQMRTIPISEEVTPERRIGTYDDARQLVMRSEGPLGVINCVCRQGMDLQGEPCRQTEIRETCLLLKDFAKGAIESGDAREVSPAEMLGLLDRADEIGMVLQPQNTQDPGFICCCCGCCCGVLSTARKLPRPAEYFDTNYFAAVDAESCTGCETCEDRCQMGAISYADGVASVDQRLCIGCGLCVSTCPQDAMHLVQKEATKTPPKDAGDLYKQIMIERYGLLGALKFVGKKALGMRT
jgi:ferredoxin